MGTGGTGGKGKDSWCRANFGTTHVYIHLLQCISFSSHFIFPTDAQRHLIAVLD